MTYHDVMLTTERLDLAHPGRVAATVDALNDRLAAEAQIPAAIGAEVAGLAAAAIGVAVARKRRKAR